MATMILLPNADGTADSEWVDVGESSHYDGLDAESVANPLLTNEDNDIPEIIVSAPNSVSENGTTSILNVRLGTKILSYVSSSIKNFD